MEVISFIADSFILGLLNASISSEQAAQLFPSSFGGLARANVRQLLWRHGVLDDVQCGGIELAIHHFAPCQVIGEDGRKTSIDDVPHFY